MRRLAVLAAAVGRRRRSCVVACAAPPGATPPSAARRPLRAGARWPARPAARAGRAARPASARRRVASAHARARAGSRRAGRAERSAGGRRRRPTICPCATRSCASTTPLGDRPRWRRSSTPATPTGTAARSPATGRPICSRSRPPSASTATGRTPTTSCATPSAPTRARRPPTSTGATLLLEKHNGPDAEAAFRDVLKVDPDNPDAHVGPGARRGRRSLRRRRPRATSWRARWR